MSGISRATSSEAKEVIEFYLNGLGMKSIAKKVNRNRETIRDWLVRADVPLRIKRGDEVRTNRTIEDHLKTWNASWNTTSIKDKLCLECSQKFIPHKTTQKYCSVKCKNTAVAKVRKTRSAPLCSCGKTCPDVHTSTGLLYWRKYCSSECRKKYHQGRGRKEDTWLTKICETCEISFEYPHTQKNRRFCSNECAKRGYLKTRIGVNEDNYAVVLDSSWESVFWGLTRMLKIPIRRYDSSAYNTSVGNYRPDFIVNDSITVDVKGYEDWRVTQYKKELTDVVFIDKSRLDILRKVDSVEEFLQVLMSSSS